jgi:hypothetical protein
MILMIDPWNSYADLSIITATGVFLYVMGAIKIEFSQTDQYCFP